MQRKQYLLPFILITSLFFLWAFVHNINPVLIPHLKKACELSDTQSAFIDTAVYFAYFLMALPAGWFIYKFGYKKGILLGLLLFACGFLLFIPAATYRTYSLFLLALFIGASGATFLETVANPYVTRLGNEASAPFRINLAQSFNGIGAFIAPIIGGKFILSGIEHSDQQLAAMRANGTLEQYLIQEASAVKAPYLVLGFIVLLVFVLLACIPLPEINEDGEQQTAFSLKIFRHRHLSWAIVAQLFYVGAQAGIGSFFIRYARQAGQYPEKQAAYLWGSIAMGISGLGAESKIAAALLVMAIAGGAILPVLMGKISDFSGGNIQLAYIVPAICFAVIAIFAFRFRNIFTTTSAIKINTHEHVPTEQ